MKNKSTKLKAAMLATAFFLLAGLPSCRTNWDSAEDFGRKVGRSIDNAVAQVEEAYDELGDPDDGPAEKIGSAVDNAVVALFNLVRHMGADREPGSQDPAS